MMGTALTVTYTALSIDLFVIGADNRMYTKTHQLELGGDKLLNDWLPSQKEWTLLGGVFSSAPAVGQRALAPTHPFGSPTVVLEAFGLGTDNQMYRMTGARGISNLGWKWDSDFHPVGGVYQRQPVVVSAFPDKFLEADLRVDVFGLGTDSAMYQQTWMGEPSGAPPPGLAFHGGRFSSSLAATRRFRSFIDVFGLGTDNQMYHQAFDGNQWLPDWSPLGGVFSSPPSAVSWGENRLDLFALGTENQMYHRAWDGASWLPAGEWQPLGGAFNSLPVAVSVAPDVLDIFAIGMDNHMYHKAWKTNAWLPSPTGWQDLGGAFNSAPAATAGRGAIDVFAIDRDNRVSGCIGLAGGSLPQAIWQDFGGVCNPSP